MQSGNKGEKFVQEQLAIQRKNLLGVSKYGFVEVLGQVLYVTTVLFSECV